MKRVLHVIDTGGPGGAETVFYDLIRSLDIDRWNSIAAVPDEGWIYQKLRELGIPVFVVDSFGSFSLQYLNQLSRLIRDERVDLVHAHLLGPSIYGGIAGRVHGVPVVSTLHGSVDGDDQHAYLDTKFRLLSMGVSRVVFVSEPLREVFLSRASLRRSRTSVIENGIDLREFQRNRNGDVRRAAGFDDSHFVVGAVGNIRRAKRYDTFLRAAARMVAASPAYRFVIYGHWHGDLDPELVALRDDLGLAEHVHFAGFTSDVAEALNGLDAFLLTSESEGFSLATIQAMACELPVVATRCGGPESIIDNGRSGLLVDVGAEDQMATVIAEIRRNPQLAADMGRAARTAVTDRYSVDTQVGKYERLYEDVVARSRRHPSRSGFRRLARRLAGSITS